jgi:hypothetical protein
MTLTSQRQRSTLIEHDYFLKFGLMEAVEKVIKNLKYCMYFVVLLPTKSLIAIYFVIP